MTPKTDKKTEENIDENSPFAKLQNMVRILFDSEKDIIKKKTTPKRVLTKYTMKETDLFKKCNIKASDPFRKNIKRYMESYMIMNYIERIKIEEKKNRDDGKGKIIVKPYYWKVKISNNFDKQRLIAVLEKNVNNKYFKKLFDTELVKNELKMGDLGKTYEKFYDMLSSFLIINNKFKHNISLSELEIKSLESFKDRINHILKNNSVSQKPTEY